MEVDPIVPPQGIGSLPSSPSTPSVISSVLELLAKAPGEQTPSTPRVLILGARYWLNWTEKDSDSRTLSPRVSHELLKGIHLPKDVDFFESKEDNELFKMIDLGFLNQFMDPMKVIMDHHWTLQCKLRSVEKKVEAAVFEKAHLETELLALKKAKEESDQKVTDEEKKPAHYKKMSFELNKTINDLVAKIKVKVVPCECEEKTTEAVTKVGGAVSSNTTLAIVPAEVGAIQAIETEGIIAEAVQTDKEVLKTAMANGAKCGAIADLLSKVEALHSQISEVEKEQDGYAKTLTRIKEP
ncbi:hypothetical protein NE237_007495 [Protea cynaroides]|uniref:Uncharacterized protein n=1 Tax=Protea cynaroides TaxID=273540 RepID=A0A9Q0KPK1_9MAGN|nr:hypothetical protein NE237_007495 [Protea cynaroides]